jgi:hypothetical protein
MSPSGHEPVTLRWGQLDEQPRTRHDRRVEPTYKLDPMRRRAKLAQLRSSDTRAVREGIEQADRGEFLDLTPEQVDHFLETGELPEHAQRRVDALKRSRASSTR